MKISTTVKVSLNYDEQSLFNAFRSMIYGWEQQVNEVNNCSTIDVSDFSTALSDCLDALETIDDCVGTETETEW